jgi:long-chain acyl-CoA synthetase
MRNENYPLYEIEQYTNLKELVNTSAIKYNNEPAFTFERNNKTVNVSYSEFKSDVDAMGTALQDLGVDGMKIAVIGENSYEWIVTYFGVVNSGNVIIPLDKELPTIEIKNLIVNSDTRVLVYSNSYSDVATFLKENDASISIYINMNDIPCLIERGRKIIACGNTTIVNYAIDNQALAAILYTSGTTGTAKGVMLSHKCIVSNAIGTGHNLSLPHSSLLILPLHHSMAFTAGVIMMIITGTVIAINQSLKDLQKDIRKYRPRNILMVPLFIETFYKQILLEAKGSCDIKILKNIAAAALGGNLDTLACGGAPLDRKYIEGYRKLGITVLEGYGITECSPVIAVNRNEYYRVGSVGQITSFCEVRIMNPDEKGHGEICVKGDIVMLGYYKNEKATKEAFDGDWFKTGDIGYMDNDGFLYISGRKKNLIVLGNGKNVYPEELEFALLNQIPYIKEVIVYAEENLIVAEMYLDIENTPNCVSRLTEDILIFNQAQASYKNISKTVIRETEFPKTTTKKIKRQYK